MTSVSDHRNAQRVETKPKKTKTKLSELKDLDLAEVRTAPPVITPKTETPELD